MSKKLINDYEKLIKTKMLAIKSKNLTPKDSGIGKLINKLKLMNEPLYDELLAEYKKILYSIK